MKWPTGGLLFVVIASTAAACSESEIQVLLNRLDLAANNRDGAAVADVLRDTATIIVEMPLPRETC